MRDPIPTAVEMYQRLFKPVRLSLRVSQSSFRSYWWTNPERELGLELYWNEGMVANHLQSGICLDLKKIEIPRELPLVITLVSRASLIEAVQQVIITYLQQQVLTKCWVDVTLDIFALDALNKDSYFDAKSSRAAIFPKKTLNSPGFESAFSISQGQIELYRLLTPEARHVYDSLLEARESAWKAKEAQKQIDAATRSYEKFVGALSEAERKRIL